MKKTGRTPILFLSVVLAALACKLFVLDVMYVSGPSMAPTFTTGSFVFEYKLAWGVPVPFANRYAVRWGLPRVGDIVIFPWQNRWVIKRCLATGGMPLAFPDDGEYRIIVSDESISLNHAQYLRLRDTECVPEGMLFVVGDNRKESVDSREYGFVSVDSVRGKVLWK